MEDLTKLRPRTKNLVGNKYGRLTVDSFSHYVKYQQPMKNYPEYKPFWRCICECGGSKTVWQTSLKNGTTQSCGCLQWETRSELGKKVTATSHRRIPIKDAAFNAIYTKYKQGAKERNLEFLLSKEEFKIICEQDCHYCGDEPYLIKHHSTKIESYNYVHNGVDRKNNSLGYIVENCVPCCTDCNIQKRTRSYEDFLHHIAKIAKNLNL